MYAGIFGGADVHVGIADHDRLFRCHACVFQNHRDDLRRRLFGTAVAAAQDLIESVFTEIVLHDLFHKRLGLVGCHGDVYPGAAQLFQHFGDAGIGCSLVQAVAAVVLVECGEEPFHLVRRCVCRQAALAELVDAVPHKAIVRIQGMGGQSTLFQQAVGCAAQVGDGIDQCAVQVENGKLIHKRVTPDFSRKTTANAAVLPADRFVPIIVHDGCFVKWKGVHCPKGKPNICLLS